MTPDTAREAANGTDRPVRVIEPRPLRAGQRLREIVQYRGLLRYFGKRFIEKRYTRTWLGWFWIPLRPILDVAARVFVFGSVLNVPSGTVPYLVFYLVGMSAWELFERTAYWATRSLELNRRVLSRMYVPRLTALLAAVAPAALDYLIYVVLTFVVVFYYFLADDTWYVSFGPDALIGLAGLVLLLVLSLGIGLWTSVYAIRARDVRFGLAYFMNFLLFITPVLYPISAIPARYRPIASLNPLSAPIEMVKRGFLGEGSVPASGIAITLVTAFVLCVGGFHFFSRAESKALDHI